VGEGIGAGVWVSTGVGGIDGISTWGVGVDGVSEGTTGVVGLAGSGEGLAGSLGASGKLGEVGVGTSEPFGVEGSGMDGDAGPSGVAALSEAGRGSGAVTDTCSGIAGTEGATDSAGVTSSLAEAVTSGVREGTD
jgi:hypothetical protein